MYQIPHICCTLVSEIHVCMGSMYIYANHVYCPCVRAT